MVGLAAAAAASVPASTTPAPAARPTIFCASASAGIPRGIPSSTLLLVRFSAAFAAFRADPALAARQADRAAAVIATEVWTGVDGPAY